MTYPLAYIILLALAWALMAGAKEVSK